MSPSNNLTTSKSARAYAKTYKLGPPLVPAIVVDRILAYTSRIKIRKKTEFVQQMCRYWSLKREARRGAPLLKRLHLEPWTANASGKALTEEEQMMKLDVCCSYFAGFHEFTCCSLAIEKAQAGPCHRERVSGSREEERN
jgi:hypothetical protein